MTTLTDAQWDELRATTARVFSGAVTDWLDDIDTSDPKAAMAALAVFLGHILAATSVCLGVHRAIDADGVSQTIAEVMRSGLDDLKALGIGEALQ